MGSNSYYTGGWDVTEYNQSNVKSSRKMYYGVDKDGHRVTENVQAKDASEVIDLVGLRKAIENAEDGYISEFKKLSQDVEDLASPTDEALVVNGLSLKGKVEDLSKEITKMPDANIKKMWAKFGQARNKYHELQEKYNEEAKNKVSNRDKVVKVKEEYINSKINY